MKEQSTMLEAITHAANILHSGKLVAFPTETVYGLGADAHNPQAVKRIFTAKGRPPNHPLIVHIATAQQMNKWAQNIPDVAWKLAHAFWPGPLTLILPRLSTVPDAVTGGLDTVALRVPDHPVALALLSAFGSGIAAPSANRYGRVSPTCAEDVREELKESVDIILDGGRCPVGIESTIVDLSTKTPRILRPGGITLEMLESVMGSLETTLPSKPTQYPGGTPSHYAPKARVVLASPDNVLRHIEKWQQCEKKIGLLATFLPDALPKSIIWLPFSQEIEKQGYELYHSLREADHLDLKILIVIMPEDVGIGHAVRDRLFRAANLNDTIKYN
jgi:L-threonylcarbamoyladenylate synthase